MWKKALVVVGLHDRQRRGAKTQSFAVRAACPHPGYSRKTMDNDLLLLQVGLGPAAGEAPRSGGGAGKRRGEGAGVFARCRCSCARSRGERLADISASHPQETPLMTPLSVILPLPWALHLLGAPLRPAALGGSSSAPHPRHRGAPSGPLTCGIGGSPTHSIRVVPSDPPTRGVGVLPASPPAHGEGSDAAPRPQLDGKVTLGKTRKLISLAKREPKPGTRCSVAGWGVTDSEGKRLSPTLKELEVKVMDVRMCNNSRYWNGEIGPTMICFEGLDRGSAPAKVSTRCPPPARCGGLQGGCSPLLSR